jgi:hypothetical protein
MSSVWKNRNLAKLKKLPWFGLITAICAVVFGGMTANYAGGALDKLLQSLHQSFTSTLTCQLISGGSCLVFLLISLILLYKHQNEFEPVRSLAQSVNGDPHSCLIMFLSPPNKEIEEISREPFGLKVDNILIPTELDADIEQLDWNWRQLLRGVRLHRDELKIVYIIGSHDSGGKDGSFKSRNYAQMLFEHYFPSADIRCYHKPVNFEKFDDLAGCLTKIIEELKMANYRDRDIVIDVTGGQKTTSIAGAVVTLNKKVTFQYVQTNIPFDVLTYDVEYLSPAGL